MSPGLQTGRQTSKFPLEVPPMNWQRKVQVNYKYKIVINLVRMTK